MSRSTNLNNMGLAQTPTRVYQEAVGKMKYINQEFFFELNTFRCLYQIEKLENVLYLKSADIVFHVKQFLPLLARYYVTTFIMTL